MFNSNQTQTVSDEEKVEATLAAAEQIEERTTTTEENEHSGQEAHSTAQGAESAQDVQGVKVRQLPFAFAKRHGVLVTELHDGIAKVLCRPGVPNPVYAELRRYLGIPLRLEMIAPDDFDATLQRAYEQDTDHAMQMMDDLDDEADLFQVAEALPEPEDLLESEDDAPIIRLINAIFTQAIKENASDIHIEPFESRLTVRFRVDGVLREVLTPRRVLAPLIVSRIKVMAKLDIAEKRLPQDGRISLLVAGRAVDVRVSTIPTGQGERVVLRLLDKQAGRLDLQHLGMDVDTLQVLERVIQRPHGILLVTGPTGSGKTTTLYAALTSLNNRKRNIMTVEDPIEYNLDGVSQTNVNTKVDMSFARGLRAILRQDPDVVMVGEIRDLETAEIAVQASLTGHLVLSTLHTNSAVGAVTRLRDMGVEPFLLSSSLLGVLAQRLVRLLCNHCKEPYTANTVDCERFGFDSANPPTLYRAEGCAKCNFQGYKGRTGIYELIEVNDTMREMIHDGSGEHLIETQARKNTPSIRQDGLRRILNGETTIDEVLRVTKED
jgi:general secretion pathway protein E